MFYISDPANNNLIWANTAFAILKELPGINCVEKSIFI